MTRNRNANRAMGKRPMLACLVLATALATAGVGNAHPTTPNGFADNFEASGPLAGTTPADPYEIKSGSWSVISQTGTVAPLAGENHILTQTSKASTPVEPMVFIRGRNFKAFAAQVTAAFLDTPSQVLGDPVPSSSFGLVFRAPIDPSTALADKDNLYLFGPIVTGVAPGFPTGKAYALFKRIGRGYYLLYNNVYHTWDDLTKPHAYKVVVGGGRIKGFVDGRQVVEHVDVPSGDQPTDKDPFPGLPYDSGAVGLRTSSARAWFDNLTVVGNDAYEGRANAVDVYTQYGNSAPSVRKGASLQLTTLLARLGLPAADTGFSYHDHDFDDAIVRTVDNPGGGSPSVGASLRTSGAGGVVTSVARLSSVLLAFTDPNQQVTILIKAQAIETVATASCTGSSTMMNLQNASISVSMASAVPGANRETRRIGCRSCQPASGGAAPRRSRESRRPANRGCDARRVSTPG